MLLWWGDLLRAAVYGRWDAGCGVWCPGSSVAWGVSWTVLIPGHQQGGLGPLKLPDFFFFFPFQVFWKGQIKLTCLPWALLLCPPLSLHSSRSVYPASPLLPLRNILMEEAMRATLGRQEGFREAFRAADKKSEVSGKMEGLDLL